MCRIKRALKELIGALKITHDEGNYRLRRAREFRASDRSRRANRIAWSAQLADEHRKRLSCFGSIGANRCDGSHLGDKVAVVAGIRQRENVRVVFQADTVNSQICRVDVKGIV